MALVDANLTETRALQQLAARGVLDEHARHQLPDARPLGLGKQQLERAPSVPAAPRLARGVDREFRDPRVAVPGPIRAGRRKRHDPPFIFDDNDRMAAIEPEADLIGRAVTGLECRDAIVDALVVDLGDDGSIRPRRSTRHHRSMKLTVSVIRTSLGTPLMSAGRSSGGTTAFARPMLMAAPRQGTERAISAEAAAPCSRARAPSRSLHRSRCGTTAMTRAAAIRTTGSGSRSASLSVVSWL